MMIIFRHILVSSSFLLSITKYCSGDTSCQQDHGGDSFAFVGACGDNNYGNMCNTQDNYKVEQSCICSGVLNNGMLTYYVCLDDCQDESKHVDGQCVQCDAGKFVGSISTDQSTCWNTGCDDCCLCSGSFCANTDDGGEYLFQYVYTNYVSDDKYTYYNPSYNSPVCATCPAGTYSKQGAPYCEICDAGYYSGEGAGSCTECPAMTYSPSDIGATKCTNVDQGYYTTTPGQSEQQECAAGYYGVSSIETFSLDCTTDYDPDSTSDTMCPEDYPICFAPGDGNYCSNVCSFCPPGQFTNTSASTSCTKVSTGSYSAHYQPTESFLCPIGSYSDSEGSQYCTLCPLGKTTMEAGSTSSDDCITCSIGVDSQSYSCLSAGQGISDICWDRSQLLSLNNTAGVYDLYKLMYQSPNGLQEYVNDTINLVQDAAKSDSNIDIAFVEKHVNDIQNAPEVWLNYIYNETNLDSCVNSVVLEMQSNSDLVSLLSYQFGSATDRMNWLAYMHCSGATFGCIGNTLESCPAAVSCFRGAYSKLEPLLTAPGGITAFGYDPKVDTGRFTPMYSTSYISNSLEATLQQLSKWEATQAIIQGYINVMNEIQQTAEQTQEIVVEAINASLQVTATEETVSLNSSYTEGNLFFRQAVYNLNMTIASGETVEDGPTDLQKELKKCQRQERLKAAFSIVQATRSIAEACVDPSLAGQAVKSVASAMKSVDGMVQGGKTINSDFTSLENLESWDPFSSMPPLPVMEQDVSEEQQAYNGNSSAWYLASQKNISNALVTLSSAFWDNIYLENENTLSPYIVNPSNCKESSTIKQTVTQYLTEVKNFTNYGKAMTTALMSLVPQLGNIATGIATIQATEQATNQLSLLIPSTTAPTITTAPASYQPTLNAEYQKRFQSTTSQILGFNGALAFLMQQYMASFGVFQFCRSYEYSNAGTAYVDGSISCSEFSSKYLPTLAIFYDVINSIVAGEYLSPPPSVSALQNNLNQFATSISSNPTAWGDVPGSTSSSAINDITIYLTSENSHLYFGDLEDGKALFSLKASSDLLNLTKFSVTGVNPRVINVAAYWKGVTSLAATETVSSMIDVHGPNFVYQKDTGIPSAYQLPSFQTSQQPHFATCNSIEETGFACPVTQEVSLTWPGMDETLTFCNQDSNFQEVNPNVVGSSFLFPSLWSTWNITAEPLSWPYFQKNNIQLGVTFQYIMSETMPGNTQGVSDCYYQCANKYPGDQNPLLGKEWCTKSTCSQCIVSDISKDFCQCNSWTGQYNNCAAFSSDHNFVTTDDYKISSMVTTNSLANERNIRHLQINNRRHLQKSKKKEKKKEKKEKKKEKKEKKKKKKKKKKDKKQKKKDKKQKEEAYKLCKDFRQEITYDLIDKCGITDFEKMACDDEKNLLYFRGTMNLLHEASQSDAASVKEDLHSCINDYFTSDMSDEAFDMMFEETKTGFAEISLVGQEVATKEM